MQRERRGFARPGPDGMEGRLGRTGVLGRVRAGWGAWMSRGRSGAGPVAVRVKEQCLERWKSEAGSKGKGHSSGAGPEQGARRSGAGFVCSRPTSRT